MPKRPGGKKNQGQEPLRPLELYLLSVNKDICLWLLPNCQVTQHSPGKQAAFTHTPNPILSLNFSSADGNKEKHHQRNDTKLNSKLIYVVEKDDGEGEWNSVQ